MQIAFIVALIFAIAVAVFAVQNTTAVTVSFLWFQVQEVAISILILISVLLGAVLMVLIGIGREVRRTLALRSLRHQLTAQEQRIQELQSQLETSALPPSTAPEAPDTAPIHLTDQADAPTISQPPPSR